MIQFKTSIFFRWVGSTTNYSPYIIIIVFLRKIPDPPNSHQEKHPPFDLWWDFIPLVESRLGIRAFWVLWIWSVLWFLVPFVSAGLMWLDGRRRRNSLRSGWGFGVRFLGGWREVEFGGMDGWKMVEKRGLVQSFGLEVLKTSFLLVSELCVWNMTSFGGTNIVFPLTQVSTSIFDGIHQSSWSTILFTYFQRLLRSLNDQHSNHQRYPSYTYQFTSEHQWLDEKKTFLKWALAYYQGRTVSFR